MTDKERYDLIINQIPPELRLVFKPLTDAMDVPEMSLQKFQSRSGALFFDAWFDGSSRESSSKSSIGALIKRSDGAKIALAIKTGELTNNEAEYTAFLYVLFVSAVF